MSVVDDYAAALTANRGFLENQIGFEAVSRACRLLLARDLNDMIVTQSDRWRETDLALQRLGLDPGVGQVEVEAVPLDHFHEGSHESFLTSPHTAFPNVSCAGYVAVPSGEQFDQFDSHDITLFIETMCIAGPVLEGSETAYETIVHRRIQRTTEAVNATILAPGNRTLLGTVSPIQLPPRGGIGNASWLRREGGTGPRYLMHGSRLQYTLQRHAAF